MLELLESTLCKMQGRLFEMSAAESYDSESFIKTFMISRTAEDLDRVFSHMQWSGEAYIMSRLKDENADGLTRGTPLDNETLFWTGYIYRYWHYYTKENSKEIIKQAPVKTMQAAYLLYHTMSPEMAIDRLKQAFKDKHKK